MTDPLAQSLFLVAASLVAIAILSRWGVSPIVGYLAAGSILGPHGIGVVSEGEGLRFFGELGVALLMFFIGLEFSWPRLVASKGHTFVLGGAAVALTTTFVAIIVHLGLGASLLASALVGSAAAMSSTAIVFKHLVDTDEIATRYGAASGGIVLFEDLAAMFLIAGIGGLATSGGAVAGVVEWLPKLAFALIAFAAIAILGRPIFGRALEWVARSRLNEMFLLAILALIVGASLAARLIGLSLPIGAFMVGMIVGESDYRHQFEDEIRPLRDLLIGIFFIGMGMSVDWSQAFATPLTTLGLLASVVVVKLTVVTGVTLAWGLRLPSALRTGFILAHSGELGLLLIVQSIGASVLPAGIGQPVLGAIAISMLAAPLLAQYGPRLASAIDARAGHRDQLDKVEESSRELDRHIVMAGCGPVGRLVAITLEASQVPYLAIERNLDLLRRAEAEGHNVIFGDATRPGILKAAGLERASVFVILIHDWRKSARIVREARHLNPQIQIIASVRDDRHLGPLVEAGASHIFPENFAAGLGLAAQALISRGVPQADALDRIRRIRAQLNPELRLLVV